MVTWVLVYAGVVRFPEAQIAAAVQVLNNNTGAYLSCFVLYCLLFTTFSQHVSRRERLAYAAVALSSILLYTARGAILVVGVYAAVIMFRRVSLGRFFAATAILVSGVALSCRSPARAPRRSITAIRDD